MALGRAPKIISEIKEYIQDLKRSYEETQLPVTDDSVPLHKLCAKLEYMLQIDMKPSARSGMFAGKKDYWDYIYQCLYKVKGLDDGIRFVRAKSEVKTSLGRGRALIRYSLAHHRLGDSLQQCFNNQKVTSTWYNPNSLLLNPTLYGSLVNDLYDLNDLQFDLAPSGHDLDAAWPTHARHASSGPALSFYNTWQPPSRTESLSSLSSQPSTLDGYPSPTQEFRPGIGADERAALQQAQTELGECEQVNRELRQRIVTLEKDNDDMHRLAMETEERMSSMQSELERKMQQLQYELDKSLKESSDARKDVSKVGQDWQRKVADAEKINNDLCSRLEAVNLQHTSQAKLWQWAERDFQTKLLDAERDLARVRVEVTGVQKELEANRAMEAKKNSLIQGLEEKVGTMETKNAELLKKMEGMVDSKDAEVANHLQSANKVHELLDKLSESENRNLELKGEREALNRRIELLEDSCSTQEKEVVAKVAELEQDVAKKESEMKSINAQSQEHATEHEHLVKELKGEISALKEEKENLEYSLTEHVKLVDSSKKRVESREQELLQSRTELVNVQQRVVEASKDVERLRKELHAAGVQNEELKGRLKHTEGVCQERQREIDDLDKQIKDHSSRQTEVNELLQKEKERTTSLEQQLKDSHVQIKKIASEKNAVKGQLENMESVLCLNGESNHSRESFQKSSTVDDSVESRGLLVQEQLTKFIAERDDALEKVNKVQLENQNLLAQVRTLADNHTSDLENATQTAEVAQRTRTEVVVLQQKLEHMGKTLESKEKSLQGQSLEVQRVEGQLQRALEEKEKVELNVAKIRLAIDNKDQERNKLIADVTKLEDTRNGLQESLEAMQKEKADVERKLGEQGEVISKLMQDVERLKVEKHEVEEGRDGLQKLLERERHSTRELEDVVEDLKRVREESVSLEQVYDERKAKMSQEHADRVEFLTEQFQLLKEEQEKTSGERLHYQEQAENLGKELDEVKERCEILDSESRAVRDKNNDLNQEILRMQEEVQLSRTERNEIAEKLTQVSTETSQNLQESKVEMERLQGKVREEEERSSRIQELERALEEERKKVEAGERRAQGAEEETGRVRSTLEEEMSALRFQLSSEAMQYQHTLQGYEEQVGELQQVKARSEEQEQTIHELSTEVETLKQKMNQDKISLQKKLSEQESEAARQEQQIIIHRDSVEELSRCLDEEKKKGVTLQAKVTELRNENGSRVSSLESELLLAQDDNEQLKKQLVKLVKEKDTLWQRTEKLEYHRKMKAHERWMEDRQVSQCMLCSCEFGLTVRKHHCRLCGKIFCAKCTNFFVLTSHCKKKSRVCEQCYVGHQHSLEAASINTSIISTNSYEDSLNDSQTTMLDDHLGGSSGVVSDEGTMSDVLSESVNSEPVRMEDVDDSLRVVQGDATTASRQCEGNHSREDGVPSPTTTSENTTSEPDFEFISEDEVTAIRQDGLEEKEDGEKEGDQNRGGETNGRLLTTEELEGEGLTGEEVIVVAYQRHALPIAINSVGLMLCWEFVSSPKSIGFSVMFQEAADSNSATEELIPLCRCNSHQQAVQGELLARKPGIYTLIFDNKFSRFTSKTVKYSLHIKKPEAAY